MMIRPYRSRLEGRVQLGGKTANQSLSGALGRLHPSTMTFDQVRDFQSQLLAEGNGGSAIGRYQFIPETLESLRYRLGLRGDEPFTPALQDQLALVLARNAGVNAWLDGMLTTDTLAHNLSRIWAGLPQDASNTSYYQDIGNNTAHIDYATVVAGLEAIRH